MNQIRFQQGDKCNKLQDFNKITGLKMQIDDTDCDPVGQESGISLSFQLMLDSGSFVQFSCTHEEHCKKQNNGKNGCDKHIPSFKLTIQKCRNHFCRAERLAPMCHKGNVWHGFVVLARLPPVRFAKESRKAGYIWAILKFKRDYEGENFMDADYCWCT